MECRICHSWRLEALSEPETVTKDGETVTVDFDFMQCQNCYEIFIDTHQITVNEDRIREAVAALKNQSCA